jgi:hypothetical protein
MPCIKVKIVLAVLETVPWTCRFGGKIHMSGGPMSLTGGLQQGKSGADSLHHALYSTFLDQLPILAMTLNGSYNDGQNQVVGLLPNNSHILGNTVGVGDRQLTLAFPQC